MKLLIVDDNIEQLKSLKLALRAKGHSVSIADSGEKALSKLIAAGYKIDAVITDYAMPGMNGLELLASIKERDYFLPVIIMTAFGEKEVLISMLRHGCDGFIEKPFSIVQLVRELARIKLVADRRNDSVGIFKRIFKFTDTINDKLMVITGNTEIAMIGLEMDDNEGSTLR